LNKKLFQAASFILSLALLPMLTMPVMAQKSYSRIVFGLETVGSGLVVWGRYVVPGGNPVVGYPEYVEELDKSVMQFSGTSDKLILSEFFGATCYLFEEGSVKFLGTLTAEWTTENGESYMLCIVLVNTEETGGWFAYGMADSGILLGYYLAVGLPWRPGPPPDGEHRHPDPKDATVIFQGIYKDGDGVQKVSGRGFVVAVDAEVNGERTTRAHWNLWIEEFQTHVAFLWSSSEYMLNWAEFMEPQHPLALVPAAKVYKAHIKLIQ
jgi:hypothetical protein